MADGLGFSDVLGCAASFSGGCAVSPQRDTPPTTLVSKDMVSKEMYETESFDDEKKEWRTKVRGTPRARETKERHDDPERDEYQTERSDKHAIK